MTWTNQGAYIARAVANPRIVTSHPVDPEVFTNPFHRKAFQVITEMVRKGGEDHEIVAKVRSQLPKEKYLYRLPSLDEIVFLDMDHLVIDLKSDHRNLQIRKAVADLDVVRSGDPVDPEALKASVTKLKSMLEAEGDSGIGIQVSDAAADLYLELVGQQERVYVPTGFKTLDKYLVGLEPGCLYYVAGRPGAGKTAFGLQVALHAASQDHKVLINSAEMGLKQLGRRMFSMLSGVDTTLMRHNTLTPEDEISLSKAASHPLFSNMYVISKQSRQFERFYSETVNRNMQSGVSLVVVDYLQLLRVNARVHGWEALGIISNGLKELAKEIDAPVLAMTQLNRENVKDNEPPQLHHLRGSGDLEQAADVVLALHCDDPPARPVPYAVDCTILKNRDGQTGRIPMVFTPTTTTFTEERERRYA